MSREGLQEGLAVLTVIGLSFIAGIATYAAIRTAQHIDYKITGYRALPVLEARE